MWPRKLFVLFIYYSRYTRRLGGDFFLEAIQLKVWCDGAALVAGTRRSEELGIGMVDPGIQSFQNQEINDI